MRKSRKHQLEAAARRRELVIKTDFAIMASRAEELEYSARKRLEECKRLGCHGSYVLDSLEKFLDASRVLNKVRLNMLRLNKLGG